ncbi:MAG: tetratricopeptide repeat protein, partial [Acidobacteriota bacterium]
MKVIARVFLATALIATISTAALSQDDETRQATGLPRQIGDNTRGPKMNVSGKITLEGLAKGSRIPIVSVIATYAGVITEKAYANDLVFFVIRDVPRENVILIVEVDGIEVARNPLVPSPMSNPRVDFNIPWTSGSGTMAKPGVISAGDLYSRSNNNQLLFEKAVAFEKAKDSAKAAELFNQMLAVDPKDFVAWTELGTVFFKSNSLDNAEACYFKAIELKKDYFLALLNLGKLYLGRKQ